MIWTESATESEVFSWAVTNGYSEATVTPGGGISSAGYALTPGMISPSISPYFRPNQEGSFENPRAPPSIPHRAQLSLSSLPTIGPSRHIVPNRAALNHLVYYHQRFLSTRAAPSPPVSKEIPLQRRQDAARGPPAVPSVAELEGLAEGIERSRSTSIKAQGAK